MEYNLKFIALIVKGRTIFMHLLHNQISSDCDKYFSISKIAMFSISVYHRLFLVKRFTHSVLCSNMEVMGNKRKITLDKR